MAMPKSKTAVIIVLTVLGASLFVVALQSGWLGTTTITKNSGQPPSGSAADLYWNRAVKVVENLIKDKLKSDPSHADPDLLATWQHQVSNYNPDQRSNPEKTIETVKKILSDNPSGSKKMKQTVTVPPPPPTVPIVNRRDLPFLTRGSVEIKPERLTPPADSSDVYISLLTAPRYHDTRVSLQYLTWFQTVAPEQVQYTCMDLCLVD